MFEKVMYQEVAGSMPMDGNNIIFHLLRENCIQFCKNKGCEIKSVYPQRILETIKVQYRTMNVAAQL